MIARVGILLSLLLVCVDIEAFVRRDAPTKDHLEIFQQNIDQFRSCIDQSLAKMVSEVNEKQIQPILTVVGDQLNRVSKAFDDLTAPRNTPAATAAVETESEAN